MASKADVQAVATELPAMPLTLEGYSVLHQMFRFRWTEWRKLDEARRAEIAREVAEAFAASEEAGQFAAYSMLGHKGDLMLVYFRDSFDDLNQAELVLNRTGLQEFLEPTHSYLSVIELGLYDSSMKLFQAAYRAGIGSADGRVEQGSGGDDRAAKAGDAAAIVSQDSGEPVFVFLSDGSPSRRGQELVHAAH